MKKSVLTFGTLTVLAALFAWIGPDLPSPQDGALNSRAPLLGTLSTQQTATKWVEIFGEPGDRADLEILEETSSYIRVGLKLPGFYHQPVTIGGTPCSRVSLPGHVAYQVEGLPEVPVVSRSVPIPKGVTLNYEVVAEESRVYKVDPVEPSLGHITRDTNPAKMLPQFGPFYQSRSVWPKPVVELGTIFDLGSQRGVNLRTYPLRYDAGKGLLLVTEMVVVEIRFVDTGITPEDPAVDTGAREREFTTVLKTVFGDAAPEPSLADKYDAPTDRGRMLIITTDALATGLDPFTRWKRQLGIPVTVQTVEEIGATPDAIHSAIADAYRQDEGLTWVLLVGDHDQVPPREGLYDGSDSDTRYAMLAGDDIYPDVYLSRISAKDLTDLSTQINKFIAYEKEPQTGTAAGWYGRAAGIASDEGVPSDSQRAELLAAVLLDYGFSEVTGIYEGQGGNSSAISQAVNGGVSLINYLGHGEGTYWSSVYYGTNQVHDLDNGPYWPWVVDVSCSNGDFAMEECLAEAWLRAGTPDQPQGAVGMISASSLAPWVPPTVMQTEVVELLTSDESFTLGGLCYSGLMKVADEYTGVSVAQQVMEQNVVFGDASMMVRTADPGTYTVYGPSDLVSTQGQWQGQVTGPAGSLVTLTTDDALLGVTEVDASGAVTVAWDGLLDGVGQVTLTVSGYNMVPNIQILSVDGSLVEEPEDDPEPDPEPTATLPAEVTLRGNFPNPFNPSTAIAFDLPREMSVRLTIYDIRGRLVRTLVDETRAAGAQEAMWDGKDHGGGALASGIYLYRLETPDGARTGRMTLSK